MPLAFKPQSREVYISWIKKIINQDINLNEWEKSFISSLFYRLQKFDLTENLAKRLELIYSERTK